MYNVHLYVVICYFICRFVEASRLYILLKHTVKLLIAVSGGIVPLCFYQPSIYFYSP
jgi:cell division protein FtsX